MHYNGSICCVSGALSTIGGVQVPETSGRKIQGEGDQIRRVGPGASEESDVGDGVVQLVYFLRFSGPVVPE